MTGFIDWANRQSNTDLVLKAAIAHLWFVTIHPFDDGNGRIARAIADGLLAQSERSAQRFYSMSAQIRQERNAYYAVLEETQKGTLDITGWMEWLLGCLDRAFGGTETTLATVRVIHGRKRKRERTAARSQWAVGRGQRAAGSKQA
jgi:Fic family protein